VTTPKLRNPDAVTSWVAVVVVLTLTSCSETDVSATFEGLGAARIGLSAAELAEVLGKPLDPIDPEEASCFYVAGDAAYSYQFMVAGGKVARIDVDTATIATGLGARVGDSIDRVRQLYGPALEETPHFYTGSRGDLYLTFWSPDRASALRFETSDGKISRFYIGRAAEVQYVEGCL
jgi:hypothetical protein